MIDERRDAVARVGEAQEFYAHALRMGDEALAERARDELRSARRELAAVTTVPQEALEALDADVARLRDRLAAPERSEAALPARLASTERLTVATSAWADDAIIAGLVEEQTLSSAPVLRAVSRRMLAERHSIKLAALGTGLADELAYLDANLEAIRREREGAAGRGTGAGFRRRGAFREIELLAALVGLVSSGVAQYVIAFAAFSDIFVSALAVALALGYVGTLAVFASLVGMTAAALPPGLLKPVRLGIALRTLSPLTVALLGLLGLPVATALLATDVVDLAATYALLGVTFAGIVAALGYRLATTRGTSGSSRADAGDHDPAKLERDDAALQAQRLAALRRHLAQAEEILADARRIDALFLHHSFVQTPATEGEGVPPPVDPTEPSWLQFVRDELARASAEDARRSASASTS